MGSTQTKNATILDATSTPDNTLDSDSDGVCDESDNCPNTENWIQRDGDSDGIGDACDPCPEAHADSDAGMACAMMMDGGAADGGDDGGFINPSMDSGAVADAGADAGAMADTGAPVMDAGLPRPDGGPDDGGAEADGGDGRERDAGRRVDAERSNDASVPTDEGSAGCAAAPGSAPLALWFFLAVVVVRQHRRHRCGTR